MKKIGEWKYRNGLTRIITLLLIAVMTSFAVYNLLTLIPADRGSKPTPKATIEYTDDGNIREIATNFEIDGGTDKKEYGYYNTTVNIDETDRLVSYTAGDSEVEFESNYVSGLLVDTVKYRGRQVMEKTYFGGDMKPDIVEYGDFSVMYDYNADGTIRAVKTNENTVQATRAQMTAEQRRGGSGAGAHAAARSTGETIAVKSNGKTVYEYETDAQSRIVYEADAINGCAYGYTYIGGTLTEIKKYRIFDGIAFNYETIDVAQNFDFDFVDTRYGYEYGGKTYITKSASENETTYYSYVNDRLTVEITDGAMTEYILDGELKYAGLVYDGETFFYGYDTLGRIDALLDRYGNVVVKYYFTATGELYAIAGAFAETLGKANSILFDGKGVYDHVRGVYYTADGVYDPATSRTKKIADGTTATVVNTTATAEEYLKKAPVNKHTVIHDKVMQIVSAYFDREKVEVGFGLYVETEAGEKTGIVDIYTLPYEIAPFTCGNLLNGNQVYDVVLNTETQLRNAREKMRELTDENSDKRVNYFSSYKPQSGTMDICGEFVFLGSLIRYATIENGIIIYDVLENTSDNYSGKTNVYDYDRSLYIIFNKPDYEIEMFEGVRIIAGMTQEYYDNVQEQLEVAQANAQLTSDKINAYEDPAIFNTNDSKNIWDLVKIPNGMTWVFDENGEASVKKLPEPESGRFWRAVALGVAVVATIVVTAVVTIATVGCGTPIVAAVCAGALIGAGTGFVIGAATGFAFELGSQIASGEDIDWAAIGMTALEFGVTCAEVGGITGAALGGGLAFGGCFVAGTEVATPEGNTAIEDIAVGDTVLARNDKTGETEEKEVTETYVKQAHETVKLTVDGEEIETTKGHPVYVENKGYIAASQLRAGDILVDVNGEKHVLEKVRHELKERPISVYNFAVADDHNYYVGKTGVLVHNVCGGITLSGKQTEALIAYAMFTGLSISEILILLAIGKVTWFEIFTCEITDENEKEKASDIDWDLPKPRPNNDEPHYRFAFIENGIKNDIHIEKTQFTLTEASLIIALTFLVIDINELIDDLKKNPSDIEFASKFINLDIDINNFVMKYVERLYKEIIKMDNEANIYAIGFYTKNKPHALALQICASTLLELLGVDIITSHHYKPEELSNKTAAQYKHYHVKLKNLDYLNDFSQYGDEFLKKLGNYHLFYDKRVR